MNKKIVLLLGASAVIILIITVVMINNRLQQEKEINLDNNVSKNNEIITDVGKTSIKQEENIKEFSMTSFVDVIDGKYYPQFSLKEIVVHKGDKVRIKITVTKGNHDFKIDEYGIYANTQLDKEEVVEFTADKAGEFVYYCAKPGHRALGHWGTLKVLEQ